VKKGRGKKRGSLKGGESKGKREKRGEGTSMKKGREWKETRLKERFSKI